MQTNFTENWLTPSFFDDPYPFYDELRRADPVHWSDRLNGWIVTGYKPAAAALKDPYTFSSVGRMAALLDALPASERGRFKLIEDHFGSGLIRSDPPDHTRLRALISKTFTPRAVAHLRRRIAQIGHDLVDGASAK